MRAVEVLPIGECFCAVPLVVDPFASQPVNWRRGLTGDDVRSRNSLTLTRSQRLRPPGKGAQ